METQLIYEKERPNGGRIRLRSSDFHFIDFAITFFRKEGGIVLKRGKNKCFRFIHNHLSI